MLLNINPKDATPVYAQIMQQIKYAIASETLKPGDRLPTVRELAAQLLINPNTVLKVFGELEHEGFVVSQKGKGIFVSGEANSLSQKDRETLLKERSQALAADGIHLGVSLPRIQKILEEEFNKLKSLSSHSKTSSEKK